MIGTLDRMLFGAYLRSYAIVLSCLLSLYIVVDLFMNLDDFSSRGGGLLAVVKHIGSYYGYRVSQIFDKLAEPITLMAAVFTVSWMQRNNELLPQLSAGIPTRRVLRPVLAGAALTLSLGPLNSEFVIPRIADQLMAPRNDPEMSRAVVVSGTYDGNGVHFEGTAGYRNERRIWKFFATFPESSPSGMVHLVAEDAVYYAPGERAGSAAGGWLLTRATPETFDGPLPTSLEALGPGRYFLKTQDVDFDKMTRGGTWYIYASTPKLQEMLSRPEPRRLSPVAVLFHMRITRPVCGALLVLLGLAVILRDQTRHVFISAGLCIVVAVLFYASGMLCKYLGEHDLISPPLAAWLPVLIYGPISVAYFDAMHT